MVTFNKNSHRLTLLQGFDDHRGFLTVGQTPHNLPFRVERFFVVTNVPYGEARGIHAHKKCHQFLICVAGSINAMFDDGKTREVFMLDRPDRGLHMPPLTWGAQYDFSPDAVLLVLASDRYDAKDYVHKYDEFLELVNNKNMDK